MRGAGQAGYARLALDPTHVQFDKMSTTPTFLGIAAGDWLQAAAGFLGVIVTILGTLGIERWRRSAPDREARARLKEVIDAISESAAVICAGLPDDPTDHDGYLRSIAMQTAFKDAIEIYRFVRADTNVKDLKIWRAVRQLDSVLDANAGMLENELRLLIADGHHTQVFKINHSKVLAAAELIAEATAAVPAIH
jgi:hypothetical protein